MLKIIGQGSSFKGCLSDESGFCTYILVIFVPQFYLADLPLLVVVNYSLNNHTKAVYLSICTLEEKELSGSSINRDSPSFPVNDTMTALERRKRVGSSLYCLCGEVPPHLCRGPMYPCVKERATTLIPLFSTSIQSFHFSNTACTQKRWPFSVVSLVKKCKRVSWIC